MSAKVDPSQKKVVELPATARCIVEAGPGYGKTYVACARIARLVEQGTEPTRVLLLSFTRTAVREMRTRVAEMVKAGVEVAGVEIRTLDSFFWRLRTGHSEVDRKAPSAWGYEESIAKVVDMLGEPSDALLEDVERFDHVFVDEAQDLVGARAELIKAFLGKLRPDCGYTVFLDRAQAIYGWTEEGEQSKGVEFADLIDELDPAPERHELTELHRSGDPRLKWLVLEVRKLALGRARAKGSRTDAVKRKIAVHFPFADEEILEVVKKASRGRGTTLALFRTRFEALEMSGRLAEDGVAHRLRIGGLPPVVAPWVACIACRSPDPVLDRGGFDFAWKATAAGTRWTDGWSADEAWLALRRIAAEGRTRVSFTRVADRLSMASAPDHLTLKEPGSGNLIVGTIHGSKGREADGVVACLPGSRDTGADEDEAKVLYVAVTRARSNLAVVDAKGLRWGREHDRSWSKARTGSIRVEIGKPGDIDIMASAQASIQKRLEAFDGRILALSSLSMKEEGWRRRLALADKDEEVLGALQGGEGGLTRDLFAIARRGWGQNSHPGGWIGYFRWVDVTTVAARADDPELNRAEAKYRQSRLWLAPVVAGLGVMKQPRGRS